MPRLTQSRLTHGDQEELPPVYKYHNSSRSPDGSHGGELIKTVGTKRCGRRKTHPLARKIQKAPFHLDTGYSEGLFHFATEYKKYDGLVMPGWEARLTKTSNQVIHTRIKKASDEYTIPPDSQSPRRLTPRG